MTEETEIKTQKKKFKFDLSRSTNFLFGLLLIYFLFFGFVANTGGYEEQNNPGAKLLFVYTAFFNNVDLFHVWGLNLPSFIEARLYLIPCWFSIFIFFAIGAIQAYREDFLVYGIKNNIWMVPFILMISWFWYTFNYRKVLPLSILSTLGQYFGDYRGYLNILVLLVLNILSGILGSFIKCKVQQKRARIQILARQMTRSESSAV